MNCRSRKVIANIITLATVLGMTCPLSYADGFADIGKDENIGDVALVQSTNEDIGKIGEECVDIDKVQSSTTDNDEINRDTVNTNFDVSESKDAVFSLASDASDADLTATVEFGKDADGKISNVDTVKPYISIVFNMAVDESTLGPETVQIMSGDTAVDYNTYAYDAQTNTYTIDYCSLKTDTEYTLRVTNAVKSADGDKFAQAHEESFKTAVVVPVPYEDNSIINNVVLGKTAQIDESLRWSETTGPEYVSDGQLYNYAYMKKPEEAGKKQYYLWDLGAAYEISAILMAERSLGYMTDSNGCVFAGCNEYPLTEDGDLDSSKLTAMYKLDSSNWLRGLEVRTVGADDFSTGSARFRYVVCYRDAQTSNNIWSVLCLSEIGFYAKNALMPSVETIDLGGNASGEITSLGTEKPYISIVFSHDMDPDTLNLQSIRIMSGKTTVNYDKYSYDEQTRTYTIDYYSLLSDTNYTLYIDQTALSADGEELTKQYVKSFKTGAIINTPYEEGNIISNLVVGLKATVDPEYEIADTSPISDGDKYSAIYMKPVTGKKQYYLWDLGNAYDICGIYMAERSLGYQSDSAGCIFAGSNEYLMTEDGQLDTSKLTQIYALPGYLQGNEERTVGINSFSTKDTRFRYVVCYREPNSYLCLTEIGFYGKMSVMLKEINCSASGKNITFTIKTRSHIPGSLRVLAVPYDAAGKMINEPILRELDFQSGDASLSDTLSYAADGIKKVKLFVLDDENINKLIYDVKEISMSE